MLNLQLCGSILLEWCKFRPYTHRWQGLRVLITHVRLFSFPLSVNGFLAASPEDFFFLMFLFFFF